MYCGTVQSQILHETALTVGSQDYCLHLPWKLEVPQEGLSPERKKAKTSLPSHHAYTRTVHYPGTVPDGNELLAKVSHVSCL